MASNGEDGEGSMTKEDIKNRLEKFVFQAYKELFTDDGSTAYASHRAQKIFGVSELEFEQLVSLPTYARFVKEAREVGISVDSFSREELAEIDGMVKYLRARRMYDIIDGRDVNSFDLEIMRHSLDVVDGKVSA